MNDQSFPNTHAQSPPQFTRKRTHSVSEDFQDIIGRPSWSAQDRGNGYPIEDNQRLFMLTSEEPALNGNRRTSFGEMSLIGSLVTGSNEDVLKA